MSISFVGSSDSVRGSQFHLIGSTSWSSNTSSVSFSYDPTQYISLVLYWWIDHSPNWNHTLLRFRNSSGDITSNYSFSTEWQPVSATAGTTPDFNGNTSIENAGSGRSYIWLAGNGTIYDSHGWCQITTNGTYNDGTYSDYPWTRTNATLIQSPRSANPTYNERGAGACYATQSSNITGLTVFGSGGASRRGYVTLIGYKRNPLL